MLGFFYIFNRFISSILISNTIELIFTYNSNASGSSYANIGHSYSHPSYAYGSN